jgi:hypothetical protein
MKKTILFLALACGCSSGRFADRAILWREPDTAPIPQPKTVEVWFDWIGVRDALWLPARRELSLDYGHESINVNALDEVPDSTWFADPRRIVDADGAVRGLRTFSPEEMERGAMGDEDPPEPPFTVIKGKGVGANPGFQVLDRRGRKYLFKMDPPGLIGMDTATEVVVSRLAWAAGWNVPAECLVDFSLDDIRLSPKATTLNPIGEKVPFRASSLERLLASLPTLPDGRIRAVASRWIEGKIIGPFAYIGLRKDDPNDRVPHQNRRDLRAFGVFSAWVNNIDSLETNTLDSYVGEAGRGHVLHYQQDVGGAFGARAEGPIDWWMGHEVYLAPRRIFASLFTLGLRPQPWDGDTPERRARNVGEFPELGNFDWEHFNPDKWHPVLDNPAFERLTPRDAYWGAKRVLAFSEEELRAAIRTGRYRPATEQKLFEILWKRREKVLRADLSRVSALDYFHFERDGLCFEDLWVRAGLGGRSGMEYGAVGDGVSGSREAGNGTQCVTVRPREGYHVVELRVKRPGERHPEPTVKVHFVETRGARRLVGIERLD